jgi:hypothetical protein
MGRSSHCRMCSRALAALVASRTVAEHQSITRQMATGVCDTCSRLRLVAAGDFVRALDDLLLITYMGADRCPRGTPPHSAMTQATRRLHAAEAHCVRLKLWPATERSTT